MGVTVEHREQSGHAHGDCERSFHPERDHRAEHDDRGGDPEFDERHRDSVEAESAGGCHHQHEGRRHQPQRTPAELPGENADRDHRQHVVEPAERMREAVHKTVRVADAGMRQGGGRDEREGGGERADQTMVHGGFLPLQGKNIETKLHIKHANARQERAP